MELVRTHTYTAKLSAQTHRCLGEFLEQQRQLWNGALQERIDAYKKLGKTITSYDQCKSLTEIRRECEGFADYSCSSQRTVLMRLDKAFKDFFRRVKAGGKPGFPRFKGVGRVRSFDVPTFKIHRSGVWNSFVVKGIGRFRFKGEIGGDAKLVRVVVTARRVKIQVVCAIEKEVSEDRGDVVGIDVGIKERVVLSTGHMEPKRVVDLGEARCRQRVLSRAVKGSVNRGKKRLMLARERQRVREAELGNLHELTANLIKNEGCRFYVEDLQIGNLVKNHSLAKSILEQQWGTLVRLLTYKAESAGGWVRRVDPVNTSQKCSECGCMPSEKLTLKDRIYECEHCGFAGDRDVNAARNILRKGLDEDLPPAGNAPGRGKEVDELVSLGMGDRVEQCIGMRRAA